MLWVTGLSVKHNAANSHLNTHLFMKILFICTHNRCRSILAEAITNPLSDGNLVARSAGSQPAGEIHPLTLKFLNQSGINTAELKSQSWDEMKDFSPDVVITVCDSAANEACPIWMGDSLKVHWGLPDPSKLTANDKDIEDAFLNVIKTIETFIKHLLTPQPNTISKDNIQSTLQQMREV